MTPSLAARRSVARVVSDGGRVSLLRACLALEQVAGECAAEFAEGWRLDVLTVTGYTYCDSCGRRFP